MINAWTDYPVVAKGDIANKEAPIRPVIILTYDQNKYCLVRFPDLDNHEMEIKSGYLYTKPGRCGDVPIVPISSLYKLGRTL
jgi:hypothetical protein